jgi:hypothetical protein
LDWDLEKNAIPVNEPQSAGIILLRLILITRPRSAPAEDIIGFLNV